MKAILISIKPKYVADILNHKKTIEVRKSFPKCDLPIDVYIYCTLTKNNGIFLYDMKHDKPILRNGKVVAKFTLNEVEEIKFFDYVSPDDDYSVEEYRTDDMDAFDLCSLACLEYDELEDYLYPNNGYAWHIDNLVIFDKPKELSEFYKIGYEEAYDLASLGWDSEECLDYHASIKRLNKQYQLTKAPQSYMFIEV